MAIGAVVLVIAVAIGVGAMSSTRNAEPAAPVTRDAGSTSGILKGGDPVSVGQPVDVGEPFSDGLLWVTNSGPSDVILDDVSLVAQDPAIKVVGFYLKRNNQHSVGFNRGYSTRWGEQLRGSVIAPGKRVQIVIGLALTRPGAHAFRAVAVDYHTKSGRKVATFPSAARMCAPRTRSMGSCSPARPLVR
jgi:hypothetical protein